MAGWLAGAGEKQRRWWLTLNKLGSVWTVGELLLEGVAAGWVGAGDGGLVDLDVVDLWGGVLVSHVEKKKKKGDSYKVR